MLLFRSEAALERWLVKNNYARGATLTVAQVWELAQLWYHNRLALDYHGRSIEQVQAIFQQLGLTASFWRTEQT